MWALSCPCGTDLGSHSASSCVAVDPVSPRSFPLSLQSTDSDGHVVIGCMVQDFFPPESVNVTWDHKGKGTSVMNFPPVHVAGGLYTMSSQLTLPADQCPAKGTQKCHVQHNSSPSQTVDVPCSTGQRLCQGRVGALSFPWWNHIPHWGSPQTRVGSHWVPNG